MEERKKQFYLISDAAKQLHVESHVLRYWEDELSLHIPRNNMGHRIYSESQIDQFRKILLLKEEGYSLKEISDKISSDTTISYLPQKTTDTHVIPYPINDTPPSEKDKLEQFKSLLQRIMSEALNEQAQTFSEHISKDLSIRINKEMDYLIREKDSQDEERYKKLDELIRTIQKARQESAATENISPERKLSRKEKRILKKYQALNKE